jgi:hypothetical protein
MEILMKHPHRMFFTILVISICFNSGCNIEAPAIENSQNGICSELSGSNYIPTVVSDFVCIAKDTQGILYVVDKQDGQLRCFISSNDTLYRINVAGSSIIGENYYSLSLDSGRTLLFCNISGKWDNAYVGSTSRCQKCDSIIMSQLVSGGRSPENIDAGWSLVCKYLDAGNEKFQALSTAGISDVNNFAIRNFSPGTTIEYLAQQDNGLVLLVSRETNDWKGSVTVHYGKKDELKKRDVTRFLRASDGGSTWIDFIVGEKKVTAFFGVQWGSNGIRPGKTFIKIENDTLALERIQPDKAILSDLGCNCTHQINW